jgi:hypothetical protein
MRKLYFFLKSGTVANVASRTAQSIVVINYLVICGNHVIMLGKNIIKVINPN